jgi:Zn-dependent protease with chaperone function
MLPNHGEITDLSPRSAAKIRSLSRVLRAADRERVYVLKVVDVPQAAAANHLRSVLVITGPVLDLLDADELQAIVAHELAHEYVWRDYDDASKRRDNERLQELELVCDAVAVLILWRAGVDGAALPRALERISRYNDDRLGRAMNAASYPALMKRRELVRALTAALISG